MKLRLQFDCVFIPKHAFTFADSSQRGAANIGFLGATPTLSPSHTSSLGLGSLFRADAQTGCPLSSRSTRLPLDFYLYDALWA